MRKWFFAIVILLSVACRDTPGVPANPNALERNRAANNTEENIYRAADSMMAAFRRHDWEAFAGYNHPSMLQMMGGKDKFIAFIGEQMKHLPDTAVKAIGAKDILQVVTTDNDMQCVVEQYMHLHLEGVDIITTTYLVGESLDEGKSWTFFDASTNGLVTPKDIKPNLSSELQIPAQKKEVKQNGTPL